MKITTEEFDKFVKYFKRMQEILGLADYHVKFVFRKLGDSHAEIDWDIANRLATVMVNTWQPNGDLRDMFSLAEHEVFHLLHADLIELGKERFVTKEQIDREEESVVRALQNYTVWVRGKCK